MSLRESINPRTFKKRVQLMERLYAKTHKYRVDYLPENYNQTLTCWDCGETKNRRLFPYRIQYKYNKEKRCKLCNKLNHINRRNEMTDKQYIHSIYEASRRSASRRLSKRNLTHTLLEDDIHDLLKEQDYKCIYTGLNLYYKPNLTLYNLSIDRVDSGAGYHRHNVQIVIYWANQAKNNLPHYDFLYFIKLVYNNNHKTYPPIKLGMDEHSKKIINSHLKMCRALAKKRMKRGRDECGIFDITCDEIWEIAQAQGMKCVYTGLELNFKENRRDYKPSFDRIDSSKGYTKDNIQITVFWANQAKSDMEEEEFLNLIKTTYEYQVKKGTM